jgi:hypothetical protein
MSTPVQFVMYPITPVTTGTVSRAIVLWLKVAQRYLTHPDAKPVP